MNSIKAIIFDLGGVYFTDGTRIMVQTVSEKFVLNSEKVNDFLKTSNPLRNLYGKGEITADHFWNQFKKTFGINAKNEELTRMWAESYKPMQPTVKIVVKLKEIGFRLFFLSDNIKERFEYVQKMYNFESNFENGILSHIVHNTKFDGTEVFKLALDMTGEIPRHVVYIDDKEEYVKTAKKLGMLAIWFRNPEQLKAELMELGIDLNIQ